MKTKKFFNFEDLYTKYWSLTVCVGFASVSFFSAAICRCGFENRTVASNSSITGKQDFMHFLLLLSYRITNSSDYLTDFLKEWCRSG